MNASLDAAHPRRHATVSASAGTGKTWLLVARIARLLLDDARPDGILAITFTRKAAAEMQERVGQMLCELATCDDDALVRILERIGAPIDPATRARARGLYEVLLRSARPPRITTFHSFCHDLLRRFPLEADIPPGFELLENTGGWVRDAIDALYAEATANPESTIAHALETLFDHLGTANSTEALVEFAHHRGDWWAFTAGAEHPAEFAARTLAQQMRIDEQREPLESFFAQWHSALAEFAALLARHSTQTNLNHAELLTRALDPAVDTNTRFECATNVFFKTDGEARSHKPTAARAKAMGQPGEQRFLELHTQLCGVMEITRDEYRSWQTWRLSGAWFCAGQRLLEHFQRLKEEQRGLDFNDLEWKTYSLLTQSDNAHWVQYKLDQRIDHLLVDEFQDTNPVQWRMLHPLLQELASTRPERGRSAFIVGDDKQSIYRFRRADPRLFTTAREWMRERLDALEHPLDVSWRSAPAIIDVVNNAFAHAPLSDHYVQFPEHRTHRTAQWGRVEIFPLAELAQDNDPPPPDFRNPLRQPRPGQGTTRHDIEANLIAQRIRHLVDTAVPVSTDSEHRALRYSDIFILLRDRSHSPAYESALRTHRIPYTGVERGTLLASREVADLVALLNLLVTPFDNLALATVLRSPVFSCGEADLEILAHAGPAGTWRERLAAVAPTVAPDHVLAHAHRCLERWSELAGHLPVHDLLDRIFIEGNIPARYRAAVAPHLRERVVAHLVRLAEIALELDSGRYPSLGRFVARLEDARLGRDDDLDADAAHASSDSVRVLTIHGAKGLEAPVVFLADTGPRKEKPRSFHTLVNWDPAHDRPRQFFLAGKKSDFDPASRSAHGIQARAEDREEANLLYVALTRARQLLFVSGCAAKTPAPCWHDWVRSAIQRISGDPEARIHETGMRPATTSRVAAQPPAQVVDDPRLRRPLNLPRVVNEIAPSRTHQDYAPASDELDADAQLRGQIVHRLLQRLAETPRTDREQIQQAVATEFARSADDPDFLACRNEALRVLEDTDTRDLFLPRAGRRAWNEIPLVYETPGGIVHGIIDRLMVDTTTITVIDYKTHRVATQEQARGIASRFEPQLREYCLGVSRLWPGKALHALIVFTAIPARIELDL